jgi:hypothetical protein
MVAYSGDAGQYQAAYGDVSPRRNRAPSGSSNDADAFHIQSPSLSPRAGGDDRRNPFRSMF